MTIAKVIIIDTPHCRSGWYAERIRERLMSEGIEVTTIADWPMPSVVAPVPPRSSVLIGDDCGGLAHLLAQGIAQAVRISEPDISELPAIAAQSIKLMRTRAAQWKRERNGRR